MNSIPKISIIICTYNRDPYIYRSLQQLAENNFRPDAYEIVLVNNSSTDGTERECRRFEADFPSLPFRYFVEANQGLSHARNRGIAEAQGDMLVFLDDDAFVVKSYLQNLQRYLQHYPDLAAFGGKIKPLYEAGVEPKWMSKWTLSWVSAIDLGEKVVPFAGKQFPIGANMGISKKTIELVGNFNTKLGRSKKNMMAGEEKDIFNRIKSIGGQIFYFPDVEVQHVIPESRTTTDYIVRMGQGIGQSEKLRTQSLSQSQYLKRLVSEGVKWAASAVLCAGFALRLKPQKGWMLMRFRWNVTRGLLG
jgi:GT2 family glycosyltransferase